MGFPPEVRDELAAMADDRVSGATALVLRGIGLLRKTSADPELLRRTARALLECQPTMAGFATACALTVTARDPRHVLEALEHRVRRAPSAIARNAAAIAQLRRSSPDPLRVVTCSRSAAVEQTLLVLQAQGPLRVSCSKSCPQQEGVQLAERLLQAGVDVGLHSDAGLSSAIPGADALVVGADAVSDSGFINKVGTAALAALAGVSEVPVLVLAGPEKVIPDEIFARLPIREGPASEIAGAVGEPLVSAARNPYFERIPGELISYLVTDAGVLPAGAVQAGLWTPGAVEQYLSLIKSYNMLDKS